MLTVLHTSDWHIGRTLYGRKRYEEHARFLDWLVEQLSARKVDVLLVAGDVFDTIAPTNRAQELYYRFLHRAAASGCRHIVITGGNHDSSTFLDAPKSLLAALRIHVIGAMSEKMEDEVLLLRDDKGLPELVVCAVPFLRERDLRSVEDGESVEDKDRKLADGIAAHYRSIGEHAKQVRDEALKENPAGRIPIVGMGHLFAAGGAVQEDDGVRELYVGSLAQVRVSVFPDCFAYLALGHLHVPQRVDGSDTRRYCGSPLPMGFGEAAQRKQVCLITFDHEPCAMVEMVQVPVFQTLVRIAGDMDTLEACILEAKVTAPTSWLEVTYTGDEIVSDLRDRLESMIAGSALELLRIRNNRLVERTLSPMHAEETLDDLKDADVFVRCLDAHAVPENQRPSLQQAYREIVASLHELDVNAE